MARYKFDQIAFNSTDKKKPVDEDKEHYIGLEHLDSGSLKVTRWGSGVAPKGEKLLMKQGDVLFGKRRAYQKKVAIAPFNGIFSAHGMVLRPRTEVVDPDFFPLFIASDYFLDAAIKISVGSLSPTINWRNLKELEFDLPSISVQQKLAKVLWAINDTKDAYEQLIQQTDELVKSQFIEMFGRPGEDDKGWGLTTLGKCCELNPRNSTDVADDEQVSFVPMPAVSEHGTIDVSEHKSYGEVKTGFTHFEENDVLFAKITPCMENGKGAVATGLENGIGAGSTEFHVLRPIPGKSNPYWLYTLTMLDGFRDEAKKRMTGTGGQLRVPIGFLNYYPISAPPIDLQNTFESIVKQSDKSKFELNEAIKDLDAMYKRIIKDNLG